jgi:ATP-dependent Clp protease ATP-binding subunit ClpC
MFERFTPNARQAVVYAHDVASEQIGTRELIAGLQREHDGIAARALRELGLPEPPAPIPRSGSGQMPFTNPARLALEEATAEADRLGHQLIGTEHVLLGVLMHLEDDARGLVPDRERARALVLALLAGSGPPL